MFLHLNNSFMKTKTNNIHEYNYIKSKTKSSSENKQEFDVKHPYYAKIKQCKNLFQDCYDIYKIENDVKDTKLWDQEVLDAMNICKVEENKITIKRECLHFDIDISNSNIKYNAGDHVAIYPKNNESIVSINFIYIY